jgi:transcriptional regulator with XRE-family HTH domain
LIAQQELSDKDKQVKYLYELDGALQLLGVSAIMRLKDKIPCIRIQGKGEVAKGKKTKRPSVYLQIHYDVRDDAFTIKTMWQTHTGKDYYKCIEKLRGQNKDTAVDLAKNFYLTRMGEAERLSYIKARFLREAMGLEVEYVAKQLDCTLSYIYSLERGTARDDKTVPMRYATYLLDLWDKFQRQVTEISSQYKYMSFPVYVANDESRKSTRVYIGMKEDGSMPESYYRALTSQVLTRAPSIIIVDKKPRKRTFKAGGGK